MNDLDKSEIKSEDEPLFVLKYQSWKVPIRVFCWIFFGVSLNFVGISAMIDALGFKFLLASTFECLIFVAAVSIIVQTAFFKEVRLYSDRLVKIWRCFGPVEVGLANAKLVGLRLFISQKTISDRNDTIFGTFTNGISYDESLADTESVRKMNALLADLTGRKVEEFEEMKVTMDPLVKEEGNAA